MLALTLEEWSFLATIVAVAGVLLVAFQLWRDAKTSRIELITGMTTLLLTIDQMLVEHPELRKYFHAGEKLPKDETESERAQAVALAMANTWITSSRTSSQ